MNHDKYMEIALKLAKKGEGFTAPNPMVGALVVKDGNIVGKGYHKKIGENHAEVNAINEAGSHAKGATLYVSLEPCNHNGITPPCTRKIVTAGITHVVFAMRDPNPNVNGGGEFFLKEQGIKITSGICEKKARRLNEYFIKYVITGIPFVIAKCAATLDGRIATHSGDSKWITGHEARQYAHKLRNSVDAIMVGKNTILKDNPSLTTRIDNRKGRDPARIILDTNLSTPQDAKIISEISNAKTYIITGKHIAKTKKKLFESMGVIIIPLAEKNNKLNLIQLVKILGNKGFTSLLIEGGGEIMGSMLSSGLVDKICFFYAPKLLAGNDGVPICKGRGPNMIKDSIKIDDLSLHQFGKDIMVQGYVRKH